MTAKEFIEKIKDKNISDKQLARGFFEIEYPEDADPEEVLQDFEEIVETLERERPHLNI